MENANITRVKGLRGHPAGLQPTPHREMKGASLGILMFIMSGFHCAAGTASSSPCSRGCAAQ
eukprot:5230841-Heterocapsa_arctica.AAC.1